MHTAHRWTHDSVGSATVAQPMWRVWPTSRHGRWREETARHRYTLRRVQRLSCLDARIPQQKVSCCQVLISGGALLTLHLLPSVPSLSPFSCGREEDATLWSETRPWNSMEWGRTVIVLSMLLVQGLCVRWVDGSVWFVALWRPGCQISDPFGVRLGNFTAFRAQSNFTIFTPTPRFWVSPCPSEQSYNG